MEVQQQSTGLWYSAEYWSFTIGDEANDQYSINADGYSGDAGDVMHITDNDGQYYHDGMNFTTYDRDNDHYCAAETDGGWWYTDRRCYWFVLTSAYHRWNSFRPGDIQVLTSRMMIKPQQ